MTEGNYFLDILALLGGGRGHALSELTPHLLAALLWGTLCVYQFCISKDCQNRSGDLLMAGFVVACVHESVQFVVATALSLGIGTAFFESGIWPPLGLTLLAVSRLLLAGAFIQFLLSKRKTTVDFLLVSFSVIFLIYTYSAIQWFFTFGHNSTARFFEQHFAWIIDGGMVVLLATAIFICLTSLRKIRWSIAIALLAFVIESVLAIIVYQNDVALAPVLNPIRGCLPLIAIACFAYATLKLHMVTEKRITHSIQTSQRLESLGLLSSGIAHDFNNHLQIILGYTELAKVQAGTRNSSRKSLDRIEEAAERAGALVNQLLAFSLEKSPKLINVDLNEIITNLTPMLSRLLGSNIKLVHDLDLSAQAIKADARMIEQIIFNLIFNAKDAISNEGTICVQSRSLSRFDKNSYTGESGYKRTQLIVADTGKGMDEETISRIFEPFFTTKPIGEGTGLGLATVYGAVQKHNARIFVKSKPGVFTRVYVEFPAVENIDIVLPLDPVLPSAKGNGETILLAEDEVAIRELASTLLEASGYVVIEASNGQHAINIINTYKGKIDICLFDVAMPLLNGYETYDHIKALRPGIPVQFITGNTARLKNFRSEYPHLQKPFTRETLLDSLSSALGHDESMPLGSPERSLHTSDSGKP